MSKFPSFIIFGEKLLERDQISVETTVSEQKKGKYSLSDLYIRNGIIPYIYAHKDIRYIDISCL